MRLALLLSALIAAACGHKDFRAGFGCASTDSPTNDTQCNLCLAQNYCTVVDNCDHDDCGGNDYDQAALLTAENAACLGLCDQRVLTCGGFRLKDGCNSCVQTVCCNEAAACAFDDTCVSIVYQCLGKLHSALSDCEATVGVFNGVFDQLNACLQRSCPECI